MAYWLMLSMPTSTADKVTLAALPAAPSTFTRTVARVSGRVLAGADNDTCKRRSSLAIGRNARPSARAGVTRSPWLPGRNTVAETYRSWRFHALSTGISTWVPEAWTGTHLDHSMRSPSTVTRAWPSCGGVIVMATVSPGRAGTPSSLSCTRSGRLPTASASCAFQPA
ncbi:Uncharacterised protein [Bordetella pertussis]|nr:Uncharacterised protein [Bordetella pertussis]